MITRIALFLSAAVLASSLAAAQTSTPPKPAQSSAKPPTKTAPAHRPIAAKPQAKQPLKLDTDKQKASYAIGMNFGKNLAHDGVDIDPEAFLQGLKDARSGGKPMLTEDEARAAITKFQADVTAKQEQMRNQEAAAAKQAGEQFLAANRSKEGVVELPSGLQYKIMQQGSGPKPAADDTVVCNYRGTLVDGKEFDSSYKRGEPASFPVNRVIKGWTEALQLMPVGSKWQLFIPPQLAYGERGAGNGDIPPNSTLIFEVELISITPKQ